jgi:hypothetical protein
LEEYDEIKSATEFSFFLPNPGGPAMFTSEEGDHVGRNAYVTLTLASHLRTVVAAYDSVRVIRRLAVVTLPN